MEKALLFGDEMNLVGILSIPEETKKEPPIGIIIFNAGLIHHIGPYRMSVDIARGLENVGFPVLRFDFSGIGDSRKTMEPMEYHQMVQKDYHAAVDVLARYCGSEQFILIGLCSGADNAHVLMEGDTRIKGIVPIDGYAYPTLKFYLKDYGPGLINPRKWVKHGPRLFKKYILQKFNKKSDGQQNADEPEIYERTFPPKSSVMATLDNRLSDGMKAFYIYTGGVPIYYNYKNQFWDMYKRVKNRKNLTMKYYRDADHTFTSITIRRQMIADICTWCEQFL
jgi:dienelactone hydrolase